MSDLTDRYIPGLNFRQLSAYTIAVAGVLALYFDIRSEIHINRQETVNTRELMRSIEETAKEEREFRRAEMSAIRAELKLISDTQRSFDLRLTVMETLISNK